MTEEIRTLAGFPGQLEWNIGMSDGTLRKLVYISRIHSFGWRPETLLTQGLRAIYDLHRAHELQLLE